MAMKTALNRGFTLVEMSIVMLILALLTGGILIGKDIINAAEVRATVKQVEMFNLAYNTFQLKYGCWAGDCNNASQLGFSGNFSIQLSKEDGVTPDSMLAYINPVSNAYAFTLLETQVPVNSNLVPNGQGQLFDPSTGQTYPSSSTIATLNGNNNCSIENVLENSQMEGPTGLHMLAESNLINGLDPKTRVYLKLSTAFATVGDTTLPAFWVVGDLTPGESAEGYPSLIKDRGTYLMGIASFQPFAAAPIPVKEAANIDTKVDDGYPLTGVMRSSSTEQTNLVIGPTYNKNRDLGVNKCLNTVAGVTGNGSGNGGGFAPGKSAGISLGGSASSVSNDEVIYNTKTTSADAKCSQVIRLNIGGCSG